MALIIILVFMIILCVGYLMASYQRIVDNWPQYACSPMVMPFAGYFGHDTTQNFTNCIGNMQGGIMGVFTAPLDFAAGTMMTSISNLSQSMNDMRGLQAYIRNSMGGFTFDIFGILQNLMIELQKLFMGIQDITTKMFGVVTTLMYIISGTMLTGQAIMNGPIMAVLDVVTFGICFHPDTPIELLGGRRIPIKEVHLGDTLQNGSVVKGTLQLQGGVEYPYYRIYSEKLAQHIYVTGDHKIQAPPHDRFIPVRYDRRSEKTERFTETMYCLITDDHLIPVGEHIFWDWED